MEKEELKGQKPLSAGNSKRYKGGHELPSEDNNDPETYKNGHMLPPDFKSEVPLNS